MMILLRMRVHWLISEPLPMELKNALRNSDIVTLITMLIF